jgi:chaperonin GroES
VDAVLEDPRPTTLALEPLDDFVVVEYAEEEAETRAGLILPASLEAHCRSGIVIAAGPEVEGVSPGDKVLFPKDAGYDVRLAGTAQRGAEAGRPDRPHPRLTDFLEAISSDGRRVLEATLGDESPSVWIERAREREVELLWLHTNRDLSGDGFERFPGYVRLRAESPPHGEALSRLRPEHFAATQDAAFRGLWGHKLVAPDAAPPAGAVVLGLYAREEPVGLCTVFPAERLVDGPGVRADARTPDSYTRLLLGACAELGPGSVDVDSWGDGPAVIAAYEELGFAVAERNGGWQRRLD